MKFLIFFVLISAILCDSSKPIKRIINKKQLDEILSKSIKSTIIYAYSAKDNCEQCLKDIESLNTNLEGIIDSYSIFCDSNDPNSQNLEVCINYIKNVITLPEISLIEPTNSNQYKKHMIKVEEANFKFLKTLITKLSPFYSKTLYTFQDLEDYLSDTQHGFNKALFFYKTEIPLVFKGTTAEYKDRLQFAHCKFTNKEVLEHYQITNFPTLLLLKRNRAKANDFFKFEFRDKFNTTNLNRFLNKYAFQHKIKFHSPPVANEIRNYLFKYEEFEDEWNVIQEKNFNASLGFDQFKHEKISLLHITNGKTPFPLYSQIIERMSNTLVYYSLNCSKKPDNLVFAEHKLKIKSYPAVWLFHYNKTYLFNATIPITFSQNDALQLISDLVLDKSDQVTSDDNLELYIIQAFREEKIAVVLFHDSDLISISYRTFGHLSKYKPYFKFVNYKNPSEGMKTKYGIKKIPKLVAIVPQSFINAEGGTLVIGYEGVFIYHEMAKFLHHVLIKYKGDDLSNLVVNLDKQRVFEDFCLSENILFCLIGFFDANEKNLGSLKKDLEIFKKVKSQFNQINFHTLWVNVTCHNDIVKTFDLNNKKMPQTILYNQLNSQFSTLTNEFSFEQLSAVIMKYLKNPNDLTYYSGNSEKFKILNSKCDDQIEKEKVKRKDEL